jgi:exosortase
MIVSTIFSSTLYIFGPAHIRRYLFPILFLVLMVPVPAQIFSQLTIPFQLIVSTASSIAARIVNIPVLREGNIMHIPAHTLQVVHACSGLRSLIVIFVICTLIGYITLRSNISRVVLCIFAVPIAIFVNIIRVFIMIVFLHFFSINLTFGPIHTITGMAVFILALSFVFILKEVISKCENPT